MAIKGSQIIQRTVLILLIVYTKMVHAQVKADTVSIAELKKALDNPTDSTKKKLTASPFNSEVKYKAKDSIHVDIINKMVYLYGEAEVNYEKLELKAAIIVMDFKANQLKASYTLDTAGKKTGIPNFKDGGGSAEAIDADTITYSFKSKRAKISNLVMKEGEGLIYGTTVYKDTKDNIYVRDAKYTTCNAEHPHFYINASMLKIIPKKQVVTGPANLVVGDVPTPLWVPFGFFPMKQGRKSGLIMPGYGFSPGQGYFLRNLGYYYGGSDRFDLAVTGDAYTYGTWAARVSSTYAKRYKYAGNIQIAYANNQNGNPQDVGTQVVRQQNYSIQWNHRLDPKARPNTTFAANVNYQSPNYLKYNSYNPTTIVQSQINSSINYSKTFKGSSLTLSAAHSQNNQTKDVSITLPELTYNVFRFFPFKRKIQVGKSRWYEDIGMTYTFNAKNQLSTKDSLLTQGDIFSRMNNGAVHRAAVSTQFKLAKYFSLSPSVSANEYWYLRSIDKHWDTGFKRIITDTIDGFSRSADVSFSTSLTTIVYGTFVFKHSKKIQAIRHVMTPQISLVYTPDFSKPSYGVYRKVQADSGNTEMRQYSIFENTLYGGPGAGKVGQINFSLNNNLEMKVRKHTDTGYTDQKIKIFESLVFNTGYNFFADKFKMQDIAANGRTVLFKNISVMLNGTFSPYSTDSAGNRVDKYLVNQTGSLARLTFASAAVSTTLNNNTFKGKSSAGTAAAGTATGLNSLQRAAMYANPNLTAYDLAVLSNVGDFVDFNVPWNLTLNYSYSVTKIQNTSSERQSVNFSGDMNLTANWKIGFSSGYDFTAKGATITSVDFYRQLHCWEFRLNWIPFGPRQFFLFNLNVKSSVLQDLKINRRRDWYDR